MSCRRAREAVAENWGSGLPLDAAARRHVESCRHCAEIAPGLPAILELVSRMEVEEPGQDYWDGFLVSVRCRVAGESAPRRRSRLPSASPLRWWLPASTAAAFALLIVLVWAPWHAKGSAQREEEISDLRARLESRIHNAGDEARRAAVDVLPPSQIDPDPEAEGEAWSAARSVEDEESAEEALRSAAAILSPAPREGLVDPGSLVEELTASQIEKLLKEIGPIESPRVVRRSEVRTG